MLRATTPCTFSTSQLPKVPRDRQFLTLFTSKCASRHNTVHFFDISTSKSAPKLVCFVHFDLQTCFAPQRRALFRHLNFQKCSDAGVFCTFWLANVLSATTACTFSSLIWPAGSAPAALASLLFNPPEPQNHEKTQCFATFLPFRAPASSFFWLFSLLTAFSSLHIVGSLTSKLPSITFYYTPWWLWYLPFFHQSLITMNHHYLFRYPHGIPLYLHNLPQYFTIYHTLGNFDIYSLHVLFSIPSEIYYIHLYLHISPWFPMMLIVPW